MSLSVERLKELVAIMEFGNPGTMFEVSEDIANAIRELIAIKEAEPVMWMGPYHQTITAQHKNDADDLYQDFSVPLIRKPE